MKSLEQKIKDLTWENLVNKLKSILQDINLAGTGIGKKSLLATFKAKTDGGNLEFIDILENTLDNKEPFVWAKTGTGTYTLTSNEAFKGKILPRIMSAKVLVNNPLLPISEIETQYTITKINNSKVLITNTQSGNPIDFDSTSINAFELITY